MSNAYKLLERNHYLSTLVGLVKEWNRQDVVVFSQLIQLASKPAGDPQLKRLRRLPAGITARLARAIGLHPSYGSGFRGAVRGAWALQFAFGYVTERPMVAGGEFVPRRSCVLSMSWHRELTTGAVAARFFAQIVRQLEDERDYLPDSSRGARDAV